MRQAWGRRHFLLIGGVVWSAAPAAADPTVDREATLQQVLVAIDADVGDVSTLSATVAAQSKPVKQTCVDEKLRQLKANAAAARSLQSDWVSGPRNPSFAK